MVNRYNYALRRDFLDHLLTIRRRDRQTVDRYESYLRHVLLWADERPLAEAHQITPALSDYRFCWRNQAGARAANADWRWATGRSPRR